MIFHACAPLSFAPWLTNAHAPSATRSAPAAPTRVAEAARASSASRQTSRRIFLGLVCRFSCVCGERASGVSAVSARARVFNGVPWWGHAHSSSFRGGFGDRQRARIPAFNRARIWGLKPLSIILSVARCELAELKSVVSLKKKWVHSPSLPPPSSLGGLTQA